MTERARNIMIAVILAGVAALLVGLYVSSYQRHVRSGEEHITVFTATRDIPAGTSGADALSHGMIAKNEVVRRAVVPGAITQKDQINDLIAAQPIFSGEQITLRRFSRASSQGIHGEIRGTLRAVQVQGDSNQLLAGTIRHGDHVDLVATFKYKINDFTFAATRTVLRNVIVLRAPRGDSSSAGKVTTGFESNTNVMLGMTDAQAQKFNFTQNTTGSSDSAKPGWSLTLRPPVKAQDSPESLTTLDSILSDGLSSQQRSRLNGKYQGGN
jgi:Flp pilus assembly protein CpaB